MSGHSSGDVRTSLTILVLGDEGVGKSSLISTFVSRHFTEVLPGLMTQVRLPPEPDTNCMTIICDSQGGDIALAQQAQRNADRMTSSQQSLTSLWRMQHDTQEQQRLQETPVVKDQQQQIKQKAKDSSSLTTPQASTTGYSTKPTMIGPSTSSPPSSAIASMSGSQLQHHYQHQLQQYKVDSIILVYDLDRADTFFRLESHWLPLIERVYDGQIPVIVAGNKSDLVRPTPTGVKEEQSLVRSRQQIISLLQRFRFVRQCIKCSAKNLVRIHQVFVKAQQAVLYPFGPLFDLSTGTLTRDCRKAFSRIFRIYDQDFDGLLSNAELDQFQYQTFRFPLEHADIMGWKKVVTRNHHNNSTTSGGANATEEVLKDGKFTVTGFLTIFDVFISQNRLDVPWKVLRKFGYTDDLELIIPSPSESKKSKSTSTMASRLLSTSARTFLMKLFHQFDSDNDGILSYDDLQEIFSIVPGPVAIPPWHPLRASTLLVQDGALSFPVAAGAAASPSSATSMSLSDPPSPVAASNNPSMELSVSASGITIASSADTLPTVGDYYMGQSATSSQQLQPPMSFLDWMGHWHMLAVISPETARAELFRLGHISSNAMESTNKRKRRVATSSSSKTIATGSTINTATAIVLPSEELSILIMGSSGCGKTTMLQLLCEQNDHDDIVTSPTITPTPNPTSAPETRTTHKKFKRKTESSKKVASSTDEEEVVVHYILTEIPRHSDMDSLVPLLLNKQLPTLVVFVFDSRESLSDAIAMEKELLNDDIARVYMVVKGNDHTNTVIKTCDDDSTSPDCDAMAIAKNHCQELDLEPPFVTNSKEKGKENQRDAILEHFARCGLDDCGGVLSGAHSQQVPSSVRSKPHAEQKRREATRRRKMIWLGGFVSVVAVAVGVGVFFVSGKSNGRNRSGGGVGDQGAKVTGSRFGWLTSIFFGRR